MFNNNVSET